MSLLQTNYTTINRDNIFSGRYTLSICLGETYSHTFKYSIHPCYMKFIICVDHATDQFVFFFYNLDHATDQSVFFLNNFTHYTPGK